MQSYWPVSQTDAALSSYKRSHQSPQPSTQRGPEGCRHFSSWWWQRGTSLRWKQQCFTAQVQRAARTAVMCVCYIPATKRIVPMMPQIGLVTAEGGMSFLPVTGTKVWFLFLWILRLSYTQGFSFTATYRSYLIIFVDEYTEGPAAFVWRENLFITKKWRPFVKHQGPLN